MADIVDPDPPPPPPPAEPQTTTAIPIEAPPPKEGCMAKRSCLEKCLIVIVIIVLIIVVAAVCAFLIYFYFSSPPEGTCLKDNCVKSASRLKRSMDDSVDPCNDFYKYACGGWTKNQVLEPDESHRDFMTAIADSTRVNLKTIIEEPVKRDDPDYTKKPRTFYMSCMDMALRNLRGPPPFLDVVESVGKYPALDSSWNETDFDFEVLMIQLNRLQSPPFFQVHISPDLKNRDVNRLYIQPAKVNPIFVMEADQKDPEEFLKGGRKSEKVKSYEALKAQVLVLLGADPTEAVEDAKAITDFEFNLTQLVTKEADKSQFEDLYNPMTVAMLQSKYPWLQWLEFFQGLATNPEGGVGVYIGVEEMVINIDPGYFEKLGPLIEKTPKRVLANYMISRLDSFAFHLGADFKKVLEELSQKVLGIKLKPLWEDCVQLATSTFGLSVSRMYVDKYFSKDAKKYMTGMIKDLKTNFKERLTNNEWMTDEAKERAKIKLDAMASKIGYPENIYEDEVLDKMYEEISSNEKTFLENVFSHQKFLANHKFKQLREGRDPDAWPALPTTINAFNNKLTNEIIFPAAFLQEPLFSQEYSSSMNYGGIGSIIGHEITHGFDTGGSQYDQDGALKTWWSDRDVESFQSRAQCFIDQYGCYKWDGLSMDGDRTISENIADNGGVIQSFGAYRSSIDRRGSEEPRLPGLNLNHNQIFFLSYAQVWCAKYRDETKKALVALDSHAPNPYRVLGSLQNSQEFADAFNCPLGSRMNPLQKCILW